MARPASGSTLLQVLLVGTMTAGVVGGLVAFGNRMQRLKGEIYTEVMQAVRISNQPITLSFNRDDMSYRDCKNHGSDLVIRGKTSDGRNLSVSIFDSPSCVRAGLYSVLMAEEESRISFPQGNLFARSYTPPYNTQFYSLGEIPGETTFYKLGTRSGAKRADRITVRTD